jgi:hypothetical protein
MSNFGYKDAKGQVVKMPVRYGDMNRQVGAILRKNSENTIPSAPFIACYIKDIQFDRSRLQDPTFVSKVQIRERAYDSAGQEYLNTQGSNYTVERIMPTPYIITFAADLWTTNTDQKLQIWEQLAVIFTPSLEIQTTDNYLDWTSLSVLERGTTDIWSSRSVPQGLEQDIDILSMSFTSPIWITPPAKVKRLGIVTKIISNIFTQTAGVIDDPTVANIFGEPDAKVVVTPGNYELLVLNNVAQLVKSGYDLTVAHRADSWMTILDLYPGKFRAGLSQLRLTKPDGNEIVAYISLDPADDAKMLLNFDQDTVPSNSIIQGRGTVDAIVNPETYSPPTSLAAGTRYLILEDINQQSSSLNYDGPKAWKNLDSSDPQAKANDIIKWDGSYWTVIFSSNNVTDVTYVTNSYTGVQYKWVENSWSKSYEGIYDNSTWRLIL